MHDESHTPGEQDGPTMPPRSYELPPHNWWARLTLAWILITLFALVLGYKILRAGGLEQTALFYVGLPAAIALLVVLAARPQSPVGMALAVTTVGLALAGPLLDEGIVCLVMAAPLFYGVAALLGWVVARIRSARGPHALLAAPLLVAACLEGVAGVSYLPRASEGHAVGVVAAPAEEVRAALAGEPTYTDPASLFLRALPFPQPVGATGTGLEPGDVREVTFTPRRSFGIGAQPQARSMVLEVTESRITADGGHVVFTVSEDTTLARWLDLRTAEVTWRETGDGTEVAWTLRYSRTYDPSWYWGPLQGYAMDQAAGYLLDTFSP